MVTSRKSGLDKNEIPHRQTKRNYAKILGVGRLIPSYSNTPVTLGIRRHLRNSAGITFGKNRWCGVVKWNIRELV